MKKYAIVVERARRNYAAYVPDLPGCVATGKTREETERRMREAIAFHIEGMKLDGEPVPEPTIEVHIAGLREDGLPVPAPSSVVDYLEVSV